MPVQLPKRLNGEPRQQTALLPVLINSDSPIEVADPPYPLADPTRTSVRRVLVVDDDAAINLLLRTRLKARGYETTGAADGEQALSAIHDCPPDLMFLDVSMPGIGGLEVLERVRAEMLDLAVIMTTAFGSEQVATEALRRGADDYLRKPFERIELEAVLQRTVSRLEMRRQNASLRKQLDTRRRELEHELARAAQVQAELLPRDVPDLPGYELAARCIPALEVGGDFYDWHLRADGICNLAVGDVMGKGMPAALLMATVRAAMRTAARTESPEAAVQYVSEALAEDFERSGTYVTLFFAQLQPATSRVTYVDAGHGHVFALQADGTVDALPEGGLPLGMLPGQRYTQGTYELQKGAALVVYTDGLTERDAEHPIERAFLASELQGASSADELLDRLFRIGGHPETFDDDATVLALRRTP